MTTATTAYGCPNRNSALRTRLGRGTRMAMAATAPVTAAASKPVRLYLAMAA